MYFGELRFQIDRQLYPLLVKLDEALRGRAPATLYGLMANAEEADYFSRAQRAAGWGRPRWSPSRSTSRARRGCSMWRGQRCLQHRRSAAASGFPRHRARFPTVTPVAQRYIAEAGLADRIEVLPGDALSPLARRPGRGAAVVS